MKKTKIKKTEIPVTIYTGYEYEPEDTAKNKLQQIEKLAFYLESVFSLLKQASRAIEGEAAEAGYELAVFANDVEHLSEIGFGLAGAIFRPVSELETLVKSEAKTDE